MIADSNYDQPPGEMNPIVELNQIHQSGINSFSTLLVEQTKDFEKYLVATCGDDQAISCILLQFSRENSSVELLTKTHLPCSHRASVTCKFLIFQFFSIFIFSLILIGVQFFENLLFSTGPDQRVSVWKVNLLDNKLQIVHLESYFSEIADASCLDVVSNHCEKYESVVNLP